MDQIGIKKDDILENIFIEKLVFGGKGLARLSHPNPDYDGRVIFVTGGAIPGTIANLRVLRKKKSFLETQIVDIVKKSEFEVPHPTNKYGMSGGWKWVNIPYEHQLKIKQEQVEESLKSLEKLQSPLPYLEIEPSPTIDGYRNKVEFSFGKYLSKRFDIEQHFNVGFHKQGEFSKVEDFEGAPLIDELQNEIFREIKAFAKTLGLPVYDQMRNEGFFRHLLIRRTHFANEMMILLSFNPEYLELNEKIDSEEKMQLIKDFFAELAQKHSEIKSVYLSFNPHKADVCIGDLECIIGEKTITEVLHGLTFQISPTSFFQTNSTGAEKLYEMVLDFAKKEELKNQTVLDLYGGTGTIGMIFAKNGAKKVCSVELVRSASRDGEKNAKANGLHNIDFVNAKVEDFLSKYLESDNSADLLVIDPPRAGVHPKALPEIIKFNTNQIIYVSCNPTTLARDLEFIITNGNYQIEKIQAMDMFPHTHHIETVVSLIKK